MISKRTIIILFSLNVILLGVVAILLVGKPAEPLSGTILPRPQIARQSTVEGAPDTVWHRPLENEVNVQASRAPDDSAPAAEQQPAPSGGQAVQGGVVLANLGFDADPNIVPVAFASPDPSDPTWTPETLQALQYFRQRFVDAAKPLQNMDPNSPEYLAKWNELRQDFDGEFRAQFGTAAYLKYSQQLQEASANGGQ